MFVKLPTAPGVYKDDTPLKATGFYIDANQIRFVRGLPQSFGGWELATSTLLTGICRGAHTMTDTSYYTWGVFGTHTNLYAMNDSTVYDITPVVERAQLTNPFSTTITSASVNVNDTAHGRAVGDGVFFANASAVGGITVSGAYTVTTVVDVDNYTITAASAATSTAGPGGGTVDYKYFLAIGLASATSALGFSTGSYSSGTYSSASTGTIFLRTWSLCDYGGLALLACPRGGAIYEWATLPNSAPSELITNGGFTSATGWTFGAGWSWTGTVSTSTLSNAAMTQATLSPAAGSYVDVEFDLTRSAGSLQVTLGSANLGAAISATANIKRTVYSSTSGGAQTLSFTGTGFTGTIDNVTVKQLTTAEAMTNAPTQNTCIVVTPDKFVMACGTVEVSTGLFNPMHIRWSDIAPNSHTWTPSSTVQAGFWTLGIGSRIVAAKVMNSEVLVWTDKALFAGTYTNNSANPYVFRLVSDGCGLIGANAAVVLSGIAYWMGVNGYFYRYTGGAAQAMQSTIRNDVYSHIAPVQQDKIFAAAIGQFQDVMWLYPDSRDGTNEVSRYALCDTQEPAPLMGAPPPPNIGVWAPGYSTWTAWADAGIFQYPLAVNTTGQVAFTEKGQTANGANLVWMLETGAYELGSGETLYNVDSFIPDFDMLLGGATYTPRSWKYPQASSISHGPFTMTTASEVISMLSDTPLGRQIAHKFEGNASPCQMRGGAHQMEIDDTGMEF